jgi:hypothetical protein
MATAVQTDPVSGVETFSGFSWTTFFFGPLPALFRGDWIGALIGVGVLAGVVVVTWSMTETAAQLVALGAQVWWAAVYNGNHAGRAPRMKPRPAPQRTPW